MDPRTQLIEEILLIARLEHLPPEKDEHTYLWQDEGGEG